MVVNIVARRRIRGPAPQRNVVSDWNIYSGSRPMLIREQVPLAPLTTLGVGGPARYFLEATSEQEVIEGVRFARSKNLPLFILGGGSNLVIADKGFLGVVLKIALRGIEQVESIAGGVQFRVAAGENWDAFVARTVEANCAGLECLSGIPGSVGGTPVQNVGAYGQEVANTIQQVCAVDLESLKAITFSNADCKFAYRSSLFNTSDRGRYIILQAAFSLHRGAPPTIRYADLQKFFAGKTSQPTLAEVRAAVREIRHSKAMLIVPGDDDARSAGSFFKNPVIPLAQFEQLASSVRQRGLQLPGYPAGDGSRKLPAAWLVEHAGFGKGYGSGAVGISRRHTLAIVNRGGATATDIIALKDAIQHRVLEAFGIALEPEPVLVGF